MGSGRFKPRSLLDRFVLGLYNASVIYMGVREVLSRRHERRHYRFR